MSASLATILSANNGEYIANLYREYLAKPSAVDQSWQIFFGELKDDEAALLKDLAGASWTSKYLRPPAAAFGVMPAEDTPKATKPAANQSQKPAPTLDAQVITDSLQALLMIKSYRAYGHFEATLDPLGLKPIQKRVELDPATYGFGGDGLNRTVYLNGLLGFTQTKVADVLTKLRQIYCGTIGVEVEHIQNHAERAWLLNKIEAGSNRSALTADDKKRIYAQLVAAQGLEDFLHTKYVGAKRFGLDGGEAYVAAVEEILRTGVHMGITEVCIGMAHRGRLNTLTNVIGKPYTKLFAEFNGEPSTPDDTPGSGDVKYHMGYSNDRNIDGHPLHVTLTPNPSHLEVVNPVATGKVRGKQDRAKELNRASMLTLLVHGDSAFAGQGLVAETLMMSGLSGYTVGGTVHIIINNQVGFTTMPEYTRSGPYSSDITKMIGVPVFHVNGDDVEAVVHAARLCVEYRQTFGRDAVLDLICYRRNGHNEGDEPMFTQPVMYKKIKEHKSVRTQYAETLVAQGLLTTDAAKAEVDAFQQKMHDAFDATKSYKVNKADWLEGDWTGFTTALKSKFGEKRKGETAISDLTLKLLSEKLTTVPESFNLNSKIARQFEQKKDMFRTGEGFDWGTAEAIAFGSLVKDGYNVRLSGQDCGRGTFSHRHATLHDQNTMARYTPLANISPDQATFEVHDSPLSEAAVMAFEFGYSWARPNTLVLWEGQFGDFVNGAQVIIDQYISSAETKWLRMSGLVLLLPHGMEGQGPEHSSGRLERFLQLCAEDNWQVCNITTPANYFHALRRQMLRDFRKPLVVMTPKSLLRHKLAVSKASEFTGNSTFHRFLWDDAWERLDAPKKTKRVIICSGKVYYDLYEEREKRGIKNIHILRLEQFYPFPHKELAAELSKYAGAEMVWVQEEPKNQGGWSFVEPLLEEALTEAGLKNARFRYVGRPAAAAPATGYLKRHIEEQTKLVDDALKI
jgi:2-oxoglutarate dehydrogenase E1 component